MTAIGGPYATLAELKSWLGISDTNTSRDAELTRRIDSASSDINQYCHRQFGRVETASARTFKAGPGGLLLHDFWTLVDFAVVPYMGQTAGTAWDVDTLLVEPVDGIVNQVPGWPYNRISAGNGWGNDHPLWTNMLYSGTTIQVTAKWGWAAVPSNINTACLILAAQDNKSKDAPFGVAAFGDYATRIRANPMAKDKLDAYVLDGTTDTAFMVAT